MANYDSEQEEQQEKSRATRIASDAAKKAGNQVKSVAKRLAKEAMKKIIAAILPILPYIIVVVIIIVLLVAFLMTIFKISYKDGTKSSEVTQSSIEVGADGELKMNTSKMVDNALAQKEISEETIAKMTDDEKKQRLGISSNTDLNNITSSELMWELYKDTYSEYLSNKEELAKLMNTEYITQYLDTREDQSKPINWDDSNTVQGIIKLKRVTKEGNKETSKTLKYKKKADLESLISKNDKDALNYFSLDENNNVILATSKTVEYNLTTNDNLALKDSSKVNFDTFDLADYKDVKYGNAVSSEKNLYSKTVTTLEKTTFDYKSLIPDNFKMPFKYLWGLVIYSGEKDFALSLADLVRKSEMEITVYDETTVTDKKDEYKYKKTKLTESYAKIQITYNEANTHKLSDESIKNTKDEISKDWIKNDGSASIEGGSKLDKKTNKGDFSPDIETGNVEYTTTYKTKTTTNTINCNLTNANTWLMKYSNSSTYSDITPDPNEETSKIKDWKYIYYDKNEDKTNKMNEFLKTELEEKNKVTSEKEKSALKNESNAINTTDINKQIEEKKEERKNINTKLTEINKEIQNLQKKYQEKNGTINDLNDPTYKEIVKKKEEKEKIVQSIKDVNAEINKLNEKIKEKENIEQTAKDAEDGKITYYKGEIIESENYIYSKNTLINRKTTINTTNTKTTQGTPKKELKTDKNATEPNFITLLRKRPKAAESLMTVSDWFFQALESDEETADMIDVTKYLLNKYTNSSRFGSVSESKILDWLEESSFTSMVGGTSTDEALVQLIMCNENENMYNYIHGNGSYTAYLVKGYITEDKKYYLAKPDDGNSWEYNRNFGFGVNFYSVNRETGVVTWNNEDRLNKIGIDVKNVKEGDKASVKDIDDVKTSIVMDKKKEIIESAEEKKLKFNDTEIIAMVDISYQYGSLPSGFMEYYNSIKGLDKKTQKEKLTSKYSLFTDYKTRGDVRLKALVDDELETINGTKIEISSGGNGSIVQNAKKLVELTSAIGSEPATYESVRNSKSTGYTSSIYVCASFVSEVLYMTNKFNNGSDSVYSLGLNLYNDPNYELIYYKKENFIDSYGHQEYTSSVKENEEFSKLLKPGDIVGTSNGTVSQFGHVVVYIGSNQYAHHGGGGDGHPCISNNFSTSYKVKYIFRYKGN